ncbi:hypothetical protein Barb7_02060 [Bacteroidales bacterium Barb7]|nr:hypothetical protein Barb7_02060 [Bacteroidales bacterium Barb7]
MRGTGFGVHACPFAGVPSIAAVARFEYAADTSGGTSNISIDNLFCAFIQGLYFIAIQSQVEVCTPVPVLCLDNIRSQGDFKAVVFQFAHVPPNACHAGNAGYGNVEKDVVGIFAVIVKVYAEAFHETEIHADTQRIGLFPCQILVADLRNQCTGHFIVAS